MDDKQLKEFKKFDWKTPKVNFIEHVDTGGGLGNQQEDTKTNPFS